MAALKMKSGTGDFSKPQVEKHARSPDGRPICHLFGKLGYIRRFCPEKKQKEEGVTGKAIGMLRAGSGDTAGNSSEGIPLLLIDLSQLGTKEVTVQGETVEAVIDTGAAVSVMAPSTVVQLGLAIHAGGCPSIVMVNGLKAPPLGSVEFAVEIAGMIVATKGIILDMKGIRLLLGNDTLKKFKRLEIQYGEGRPKLWFDELPVGLLGEEEHGARDGASEKIIIREGRNLPPRSLVAVEIEPLSPVLACSLPERGRRGGWGDRKPD
ncbi:hypothetical protein GHT06_008842 [Daphnia sinensis]|uniref:Peptidase A2 domain-containing protein n=1 Tax=Daphnia sinensis TaxID=1820382 RepID=A0AAD5LMQ2_9CRUS|nr:hypothetical protein GHT06_008842 [Daphnia sinensis]